MGRNQIMMNPTEKGQDIALDAILMPAYLAELVDGNLGAFHALKEISIDMDIDTGFMIYEKIKELKIKGTEIYVFWNDLAKRDLIMMRYIANKVPNEILIEACSRQDYSGRQMILPYLP